MDEKSNDNLKEVAMRKESTGTLPPSQSLNFKRSILMIGAYRALSAVSATTALAEEPKPARGDKPNILVIFFGDDIGQTNISAFSFGWSATTRPTSIASPRKA